MHQLYLVRHGQSQANAEQLVSGSIGFDCPLTDYGLSQAEEIGKQLRSIPFHWVITSRLARAKHTAQAILWHNLFEPEFQVENDNFNERSMGTTEGKLRYDVIEKYGENCYDSWENRLHAKAPGGESMFEVYQRVVPFFNQSVVPLLESHNVLLVSHFHVMRSLICAIEGRPINEILDIHVRNCEIVQYDYS